MALHISRDTAIAYLTQFLTFNKARGMMAEIALNAEIRAQSTSAMDKVLDGGWLLSPKTSKSSFYRYCVFVLPTLFETNGELNEAIAALQRSRGWQALATFLAHSALGVVVSAAVIEGSSPDLIGLSTLQWRHFVFDRESLSAAIDDAPFTAWPGSRGRASKGSDWQEDVKSRFAQTTLEQVTALTLRQAFFYGYLKQRLHKPINDPYDVDAFIVSYRGSVLPVEVKEKSPTPDGAFGIDAGRILMLLRLCLATDSNALYLIREVDNSPDRNFVGWRAITLSDMITGCSWNLQAGGVGMGGGATQTVMIPADLFVEFSTDNLSEGWLEQHKSLQGSVRASAATLATGLAKFL